MAYILGQYNKNKTVEEDNDFMTYITGGRNDRRPVVSDNGVTGTTDEPFENECCRITDSLTASINYYFHGRIKRMADPQVFKIKLVNYENTPSAENVEQYIKTITVAGGNIHDWVDLEFMFTPIIVFDTILFELKRETEDYRIETRYPIIAYQELSKINNLIPKVAPREALNTEFIKIGVQSHPGLLMCINGEEVRAPRSGIYEIKNGIMLVSFFSVVAGGKELSSGIEDWMNQVDDEVDQIKKDLDDGKITQKEAERRKSLIYSKCFFDTATYPKDRKIDSFTLDYMYREE